MPAQLVIVGAGPAGVSAALWAKSRDVEPLLIEASRSAGGKLADIHFHPRDVLGVLDGDGPALAERLSIQLRAAGVAVRVDMTARALEREPATGRPSLVLESGERLGADAVLVTTGSRRRTLGVPGEPELVGRGVSYSATRDRERLRGKRVAVVGGGDAAFENALILAGEECSVVVLVRGAPTARREFRERVADQPAIEVRENVTVGAILGDAEVGGVRVIEDTTHGVSNASDVAVDAVVVKIGEVPNTEWCRGAVGLDPEGYVVVDARYRTTADRVWAAGDVIRPVLPAIAVAAGAAALAVADILGVRAPGVAGAPGAAGRSPPSPD